MLGRENILLDEWTTRKIILALAWLVQAGQGISRMFAQIYKFVVYHFPKTRRFCVVFFERASCALACKK